MSHGIRLVVIESPFAALTVKDKRANIAYAQDCMLDSLRRGEAPILSHLLYTQVLDDNKPDERTIGMSAGFAWHCVVNAVIVYTDRGISNGMKAGISLASLLEKPIEYRSLHEKETDRG